MILGQRFVFLFKRRIFYAAGPDTNIYARYNKPNANKVANLVLFASSMLKKLTDPRKRQALNPNVTGNVHHLQSSPLFCLKVRFLYPPARQHYCPDLTHDPDIT